MASVLRLSFLNRANKIFAALVNTLSSQLQLILPNRPPAFDDLEKAEYLADSLQDQCSPSKQPVDPVHVGKVEKLVSDRNSLPPQDAALTETSLTEVKTIIRDLNAKKAPGPDRITNKVLKLLPPQIVYLLVLIFNSLLNGCTFPDQWKEAIVIGIHKPGKPRNLPSSYRPISLLNSLGKVYERIVLNRLKREVERLKIIPV